MIYLFHHSRYMTEYLKFLLEDKDNFSIVRARKPMMEGEADDEDIEFFDPKKHHTILSGGAVMDETDHNFIIARYVHSPGFGIVAMMQAYARLMKQHPTCDYRFICRKEPYAHLVSTEALTDVQDQLRYHILQDPKVVTSEVDHMMCWLKECPKKAERKPGTIMIALNWLIGWEDPQIWENLLEDLPTEFEVTIVLHPFVPNIFVEYVRAIGGYQELYHDLGRRDLVPLYDSHEFILTDGSGSCYEAMVRGCKPLLLDGLSYQQPGELLYSSIQDGYVPFPRYDEFDNYNEADLQALLQEWYPYLGKVSYEEAKGIIRKEILDLAPKD